VLEAIAKVNGKCENLHPRRSKTLVAIWLSLHHNIQPGIQCAKFHLNNFSRYGYA